jgi:hypothetical protein
MLLLFGDYIIIASFPLPLVWRLTFHTWRLKPAPTILTAQNELHRIPKEPPNYHCPAVGFGGTIGQV